MVKIRLQADHKPELEQALTLFRQVFPGMNFSKPRQGSNPKYQDNQKWFSYGQPRVKHGRPVKTDFSKINPQTLKLELK